MGRRYACVERGVVGGIVPPRRKLLIGAYECSNGCAVAVLTTPGGEGLTRVAAGVVPNDRLDKLLDRLEAMGVWGLPVEEPRGGEDIYGRDTCLRVCNDGQEWFNAAPGGCMHLDSEVRPTEEQIATFDAAVAIVEEFAERWAADGAEAAREVAAMLMGCGREGSRDIAEEIRYIVGTGEDVSGGVSLEPETRAEAGGAPGLRWTLHGHMGPVDACAISADGGLVASGGEDLAIRVWDARTGLCLATLGDPDAPPPAPRDPTSMARDAMMRAFGGALTVRAIGFSEDGSRLATVDTAETVTLWNVSDGLQQLRVRRDGWRVQACRINEAEGLFRVWYATPDDELNRIDFSLADGSVVKVGDEPMPSTIHVGFRPDGGAVFAVAPPAEISAGPAQGDEQQRARGVVPLNAHDRSRGLQTKGLIFSIGNTHALFGQGGTSYLLESTRFPARRRTIRTESALVACSVARDVPVGATAVMTTLGITEPVWIWDLKRRKKVRGVATVDVTDCALSADGRTLATSSGSSFVREAGDDGVVQIWDVREG